MHFLPSLVSLRETRHLFVRERRKGEGTAVVVVEEVASQASSEFGAVVDDHLPWFSSAACHHPS